MAYTLTDFCTQTRTLLKSQPLPTALPAIAERLSQLLKNPDFVTTTFQDDMGPGKRVLYHDPETDFYVFAHVQEGGKSSKPHSHGASWAIYGNARARDGNDRMATHQSRNRRPCRAGANQQIWSRSGPNSRLRAGHHTFNRAQRKGLGGSCHRNRSRQAATLSLS